MAKKQKVRPEDTEAYQRAGGNTQKLQAGFINELVHLLVEEEPIKQARKDIMAAAKDNGLNTKALALAAKYKHADSQKRAGMTQTAKDAEVYLAAVQLSLFDGVEEAAKTSKKPVKAADKNLH